MKITRQDLVTFWLLVAVSLGAIFCGCLDRHAGAPYSTFAVLYDHRGEAPSAASLGAFDYLIVGESQMELIPDELADRCLLYFDIWGKDIYSTARRSFHCWQPGPGDIGQGDHVLNGGVHAYVWDSAHVDLFVSWITAALERYPRAAGVFLDDWGSNRFWWTGADETKAITWPFYISNRAGCSQFLAEQIFLAEKLITREVYHALGRRGLVVVNGPASQLPSTTVCHEHAGTGPESWSRITGKLPSGDPVDKYRYLHDDRRHFLLVTGLDADGELTRGGKYNLDRATKLATENKRLAVGLAFEDRPALGGSRYQLPKSPLGDPANWPRWKQ